MKKLLLQGLFLLLIPGFSFVSCQQKNADSEKAKCNADQKCPSGYECQGGFCTAHNSQGVDEICKNDEVCKDGLACVSASSAKGETSIRNNKLVCKKECQGIYKSDQTCGEGEFCAPLYDFSDPDTFRNKGACLYAECTAKNDDTQTADAIKCKPEDGDCVLLGDKAGRCFKPCTYSIDETNGAFKVNSTPVAGITCHPIGTASRLTMVEWKSGTKKLGDKCDPVGDPCEVGLVCISGVGSDLRCHKLCQAGQTVNGCDSGTTCNHLGQYAYCSIP